MSGRLLIVTGDISPTGVRLPDPSAVSTILGAAEAAGVTLGEPYRAMADDRAAGEAVPEHLHGAVTAAGARG